MATLPLHQETPRVLVIDNDPAIVEMLEVLLEEDFQVSTCLDSANAIQQASQVQPDLIIMDLMMPGLNGVQVLQSLRGDPALAGVPVILMTAHTRLNVCGLTEKDLPALNAAFLRKPFDNYKLLEMMKEMADRKVA